MSYTKNLIGMTFGQWLIEKRAESRLTQGELAKRAGISTNYVSALERDEPNAKDGSPRRPRLDKVDAIAKALNVSVDEARLAAGYAPKTIRDKPKNVAELLDAIEKLGVEGIQFPGGIEGLHDLDDDKLNDILESVKAAIEVELRREKRRK
jgi:transcriptional regulator with XRE-family HTH domain